MAARSSPRQAQLESGWTRTAVPCTKPVRAAAPSATGATQQNHPHHHASPPPEPAPSCTSRGATSHSIGGARTYPKTASHIAFCEDSGKMISAASLASEVSIKPLSMARTAPPLPTCRARRRRHGAGRETPSACGIIAPISAWQEEATPTAPPAAWTVPRHGMGRRGRSARPDARGVKAGDRVMGSGASGCAEYAVTDHRRLFHIPAAMSSRRPRRCRSRSPPCTTP